MTDDLVERVARAMWMADVEPYDPADRVPFEQAPEGAQAYCRAEARAAIAVCMEEAAKVAARHHPGSIIGHEIAAALNAWPKADQYLGAVVLPLPQEASDD